MATEIKPINQFSAEKTTPGQGADFFPIDEDQGGGTFVTKKAPAGLIAVTPVNSIAELRALRVPTSGRRGRVKAMGYYTAGDVSDIPEFVYKSGASAGTYVDNGGNVIVPTGGDGSAAWVWESYTPKGEWFGKQSVSSSSDPTTVTRLAKKAKSSSHGSDLDLSTLSISDVDVFDHLLKGNGVTVKGNQRKKLHAEVESATDLNCFDIVPSKHLKTFNAASKPVVVLVGDSISTYMANTYNRGDMLAEVLRVNIAKQCEDGITFHNRAIGGKTYADLQSVQYQSYIPWYSGLTTTTWIDVIKALSPDMVVFSFGMNDGESVSSVVFKAVVTYIKTWTKVPSMVFCTNLTPSPCSTVNSNGETELVKRDKAAGLTRSYASYLGLGLIDINRQQSIARDGFDNVCCYKQKGEYVSLSVAGNSLIGTVLCTDFSVDISCGVLADSEYFTVKTGTGANDFVFIQRVSSTVMRIIGYAGGSDSVGFVISDPSFTWPTASGYLLTFEKTGHNYAVYTRMDSQWGSFTANLAEFVIPSLGGDFYPYVNNQTKLLTSVFYYSEKKKVKPSITNKELYGVDSSDWGNNPNGGSGYNHPSTMVASHIYRPVIEKIVWRQYTGQRGDTLCNSGSTTITITLPISEKDSNFTVLYSFVGGQPGALSYVSAKTATNFTITFASATTGATYISWKVTKN